MWFKVRAGLEGRVSTEGYFPASSIEEAVSKIFAVDSKTERNYVALYSEKTNQYPTLFFDLSKLVVLALLEDGDELS